MKNHVFGAEKGHAGEVIDWLKEQAKSTDLKLEIKLDDALLSTQNFGDFDLFSLSEDTVQIRKLLVKAGKRTGVKILEGGYKEKARIIRRKKSDYAKVLKNEKVIGHIELETSRFGPKKWEVKEEERR